MKKKKKKNFIIKKKKKKKVNNFKLFIELENLLVTIRNYKY